ncbi:MAG TPA: hypothetical protein VH475_10520 [Tepidisphaeraceae bacterium]|jgi:hypothetical protein
MSDVPNLPDLGDLAKILDSKAVENVYVDAIHPASQEVGKIGSTLIKALHLFLAPFQLAAAYQNRLARILDTVRSQVPPERQVQAPAEVAGPVLLYRGRQYPQVTLFEPFDARH